MSNLHSRKKHAERLWDWEFLNPSFPGKVRPSDIDGIVELNGHFLVLEGKPAGKEIGRGQKIMLEQLAKGDRFMVLLLFGEPGEPEQLQWIGYNETPKETDVEEVRSEVDKWVEYAQTHDLPGEHGQ